MSLYGNTDDETTTPEPKDKLDAMTMTATAIPDAVVVGNSPATPAMGLLTAERDPLNAKRGGLE